MMWPADVKTTKWPTNQNKQKTMIFPPGFNRQVNPVINTRVFLSICFCFDFKLESKGHLSEIAMCNVWGTIHCPGICDGVTGELRVRYGLGLHPPRPDTGVPWPQKVSPLQNSLGAGISNGRLQYLWPWPKLPSEHLSHTYLIAYTALSSMEAGR